ncbi:sodium-dependent nutrient amino acid transporter 1-like [Onthophagus taurus]|uniref:sodium-dependent nutrient amino acid transporter 1-like n=1 Tax=Onthophagus taurus TaxID=166361 RepID=UPI000C20E3D6|nr:sodium-dependent noradrenaline transporter-like [Onthophagus taurus]
MIRVYRKKLCPTRDTEEIKKARMKILHRAIIGSDAPYNNQFVELTMVEYITLIIILECSLGNIVLFVEMVVKHGPFFVSLAYILVTITVTMPFHMLLMFLGSYSKQSFITMFSCAPLFEGLGYVVAWIRLTAELYSCSTAATALLVFYHCLTSQFKATFCNGVIKASRQGVICLPVHINHVRNYTCSSKSLIRHYSATQYYIKKNVLNYGLLKHSTLPIVNKPLLAFQFVTWLLIFILSLHGIKRLKSMTINLYFVITFVMLLSIFISLFHNHDMVHVNRAVLFGLRTNFFTSDFWSDIFLYTVRPTGFGYIIWLSTIKPKSIDTKFAIILASHIKIVIFSFIACTSSLICQELLYHLKLVNSKCLVITGFHILFSFIPDILDQTGIRRLTIPIWYSGLFYIGILAPLYNVICLSDSISQRFPVLNRYKFYVYSAICAGSFLFNVVILTSIGGFFVASFKRCSKPFVVSGLFLLFNTVLFFAYSSRRILDDYLFTFGVNPEKYWVTFWKTSPILAISVFIFVAYNHEYRSFICGGRGYIPILAYLYAVMTLAPVLLIGMYRCCVNRGKKDEKAIESNEKWSPFNPIDKENRKNFFPNREIRYRMTTLKCKHRCSRSFPAEYQKWCRIEHVKLDKLEVEWNAYVEKMGDVSMESTTMDERTVTKSVISSDS